MAKHPLRWLDSANTWAIGQLQFGHVCARSETVFPQSGQGIVAMVAPEASLAELVLIRISLNSIDRTNAGYHTSQARSEVE